MNLLRDQSVKMNVENFDNAFHVLDVLAKPGQYDDHQVILRDSRSRTWQVPMSCLTIISAPLKKETLQEGDKVTLQSDFVQYIGIGSVDSIDLASVKRVERRTGNIVGGGWETVWQDENASENPQEELKR